MQKYAYHRFLVYNPKDYYYPFKVESFRLPSSCDCVNGGYEYKPVYGSLCLVLRVSSLYPHLRGLSERLPPA